MPKSKPDGDERLQSERFIEIARELEADETGQAFERAFGKIVPPKSREQSAPPDEAD